VFRYNLRYILSSEQGGLTNGAFGGRRNRY